MVSPWSAFNLLDLPQNVVYLIINHANKDRALFRCLCRQLCVLVDSGRQKLTALPAQCPSLAEAAPRFEGLKELRLASKQWRSSTQPHQQLELSLLPLLVAAAAHWPSLTVLDCGLRDQMAPSLLVHVAAFLSQRLATITLGLSEDAGDNQHISQLLVAFAPALKQLTWGCGLVGSSSVFSALGRLSNLQQLTLGDIKEQSGGAALSLLPLASLAATLTQLVIQGLPPTVLDVPDCLSRLTGLQKLLVHPANCSQEPFLQQLAAAAGSLAALISVGILPRKPAAKEVLPTIPSAAAVAFCNHSCLHTIQVAWTLDWEVLRALATLPLLERLNVLTLDLSAGGDAIALPSLTSLNFHFFEHLGIPLAAIAPRLQELWCGAIPDPTAYPHMFSHAVVHDLYMVARIDPGTLPALSQLPKLQALMVSWRQGCAAMVTTLVQGSSNLRRLVLRSMGDKDCTDCDDCFVEAIITTLPHLSHLELPKGSSIRDHSLILLSRGARHLRRLHMHSAPHVTPLGVLAALSSTSLVQLKLVRCRQAPAAACADVLRARHALGAQCNAEVVFVE